MLSNTYYQNCKFLSIKKPHDMENDATRFCNTQFDVCNCFSIGSSHQFINPLICTTAYFNIIWISIFLRILIEVLYIVNIRNCFTNSILAMPNSANQVRTKTFLFSNPIVWKTFQCSWKEIFVVLRIWNLIILSQLWPCLDLETKRK